MFLLWTLLAGFVTLKAATGKRKVRKTSRAADAALDASQALGDRVTTEKVLAQLDARSKTEDYFEAQESADKWGERKRKVLHPKNRFMTYAAGKVDAAVATYLAYPYIPEAIDTVRGWFAV